MKAFLISIGALLVAVVPAHAQLFRRPVVQQVIHSPVTNELGEPRVGNIFFQDFPQLPMLPSSASGSPSLSVDSSVKTNLDAVDSNLGSAGDILKALSTKTASTATGDTPKETKKKKDDPIVSPGAKVAPAAPVPTDELKGLFQKLSAAPDEDTASVLRKQIQLNLKQADDKRKKTTDFVAQMKNANALLNDGKAKDAVDAFRLALKNDPTSKDAIEGLKEAMDAQRTSDLIDSIKEITAEIKNLKKGGGLQLNLPSSPISIKKAGTTTIKLELSANASADLTVTASATNIDSTLLSGKATVKMGTKAVDLTVTTTKDVPASVTEIIVSVSGAPEANGVLLRLSVKIDP